MITITPDVARSLATVVSQLVPVLGLSLIFTESRLRTMGTPDRDARRRPDRARGRDRRRADDAGHPGIQAPGSGHVSWGNPRFVFYAVAFVTFIHAILYSLVVTVDPTAKSLGVGAINVMLVNTTLFITIVMFPMTEFMVGGPSRGTRIALGLVRFLVIAAAANVLWTLVFGLRVR